MRGDRLMARFGLEESKTGLGIGYDEQTKLMYLVGRCCGLSNSASDVRLMHGEEGFFPQCTGCGKVYTGTAIDNAIKGLAESFILTQSIPKASLRRWTAGWLGVDVQNVTVEVAW